MRDETGLEFEGLNCFKSDGKDAYHAKFNYRLLDKMNQTYESVDIKIQLRGDDLANLSVASLERIALQRAINVARHLCEHIESKLD